MTALGLGLIAAFCWGIHDFAVRYLSQTVPLLAALMFVLSVGVCYQLVLLTVTSGFIALPRESIGYALGSGLCFLVADLALYFAFKRGPVRIVAPMIASYPVLSIAFAIWRGNEVALWQWLAVLVIVLGVGAAAGLGSDDEIEFPPKGPTMLLSLLAAAGFASTFALGQYATELGAGEAGNLVTRLTSLGGLVVIMLILKQTYWPGLGAIPILIVMGVLDGMALQSVLTAGGMPNAEYASVVSSIFGLLTVVFAWALLHEKMKASQWIGCLLAFAGIGALAL